MKRLWVDQAHQKCGLGKVLISAAIYLAKQLGYKRMVLDTLNTLTAANRLYAAAGFDQVDSYYHNPLPGVVYWSKHL
eukprot:gene3699-3959_t